jgi:cytosine/adenosine deaminase-related metal-dependent hydrolase
MTNKISRKAFLQLGAGMVVAATTFGSEAAGAQSRPTMSEPFPKVPTRTLIKGADVLTMEKGKSDLLGYDVLLDGGKIAGIEKSLNVGGADIVDGRGKVLMPGFTDGFRHNWQSVSVGRMLKSNNSSRYYYDGYAYQAAFMMTPEDSYFSEYIGGLEAINAGYTNVVNFANGYFAPERLDAAIQGYKQSGAAGVFCWLPEKERLRGATPEENGRQTVAARNAPLPDSTYQRAEYLRDKYLNNTEADLVFGLSNLMAFGQPLAQVIEHFKKMRTLNPRLIIQHYNRPAVLPPAGTVQNLDQLYEAGILQPDYLLGHGVSLTNDELVLMAKSGVSSASAPGEEMSYEGTLTSIHGRALQFGVPAAFAYDAPIEPVRDPFEILRMGLQVLYKTQESAKIAGSLTSKDVLAWMTSVGAIATKRGDVTGTVTVGKRADVMLVELNEFSVPSNGTLSDRVVNFCSLRDIDSVWIGGKRRKKNGQMMGVDWTKLRAERSMRDAQIWERFGRPKWAIDEA